MADAELVPVRRSVLHGLALPNLSGVVTVHAAGSAARFIYRGDLAALGEGFGLALPTQPLRAEANGDRVALWLGPDEWLLIAAVGDAAQLRSGLAAALAGMPVALVDVSHRNTALIVEGPRSAELLSAGCPLDLDVAEFPVGMCARTVFAKAEIVLWRRAPETFHVEVWRSFAPYVAGLLSDAARPMAVGA